MDDPHLVPAAAPPAIAGTDSHAAPTPSSRKPALLEAAALLQKLLWSVPETAFMCGVGVRTVWRLMADPDSGFPTPRHVRGRTLLPRDEVLRFLQKGSSR